MAEATQPAQQAKPKAPPRARFGVRIGSHVQDDRLELFTPAQLRGIAKRNGVQLSPDASKEQMVAALEQWVAKRAAKDPPEPGLDGRKPGCATVERVYKTKLGEPGGMAVFESGKDMARRDPEKFVRVPKDAKINGARDLLEVPDDDLVEEDEVREEEMSTLTVEQLRAVAEREGVRLGNAKTREQILKVLEDNEITV